MVLLAEKDTVPPGGVSESKEEWLGAGLVLNFCWSKYSDWRHFTDSHFLVNEGSLGAKRETLKLRFLLLVEAWHRSDRAAALWLGLWTVTGADSVCSCTILTLLSISLSLSPCVTTSFPVILYIYYFFFFPISILYFYWYLSFKFLFFFWVNIKNFFSFLVL